MLIFQVQQCRVGSIRRRGSRPGSHYQEQDGARSEHQTIRVDSTAVPHTSLSRVEAELSSHVMNSRSVLYTRHSSREERAQQFEILGITRCSSNEPRAQELERLCMARRSSREPHALPLAILCSTRRSPREVRVQQVKRLCITLIS